MFGVVKFFSDDKGYGFIQPEIGGKDVFVHATALQKAGIDTLKDDQRVEYEVRAGKKGPEATDLKLA